MAAAGYIWGNAGTTATLVSGGINHRNAANGREQAINGVSTVTSAVTGKITSTMDAAGMTNAANYPKATQVAGALTKVGAAAGVIPVVVKVADGKSLTVGDGLAIAASVASLFGPVGGAVAVALTIAGVGYAIYEAKNDEVKLKDLIPDIDADPSNIPHDPPSNWNDVVPSNQNNPNNEKNWCDPNDWNDWQNSPNRDGKYHVYDPLVLDLDGDGIETVGTQGYNGALFDHNSDGIRTATGWVSADDGLLVIDRNGDGVINDGTELFGDSYTLSDGSKAEHGYAALAEFDTNSDGIISAEDADFDKLKVWRDLNQDGISQEGELFTLAEVGVQSLNVAYQDVNQRLGNGNTLAQKSSYTTADGETREMGDLLLAADHLHSRYTDTIELTEEQMQAANVQGIGRLRDLREAAALSPKLAQVLAAYSKAETKAEQQNLLNKLVAEWAKTDPGYGESFSFSSDLIRTASQGTALTPTQAKAALQYTPSEEYADMILQYGQKVAALDAFSGEKSNIIYVSSDNDILKFFNVADKAMPSERTLQTAFSFAN